MILQPGLDALVVAGFVVLGVLGAMIITGALRKTALRYDHNPFLMELPPFRRPNFGQILVRSLLDRTVKIAFRAIVVAAPAGALLWLLDQFSALQILASGFHGFGQILGMNGVILLSFVLSLPANELLIPIMILIAGHGAVDSMTIQNVLCTMLFTVFHWPCATTLLTIRKETGSITKTAAAFLLPTAVGMLLCMFVNLLL